jgi:sterol desaturase/sphingolipid hydroxylase (fatty acid hydroxylase superfamily)
MPAQQTTTNGTPPVVLSPPREDEEQVRKLAVEQIERKRRFHMRAFSAGALAVMLVIIWASTEYNNAGGWPSSGFSQSSSIPHKWNSWIIYPIIALALGVVIDWWHTYRHRPITEDQIRREMDRLRGAH